MLAAHCGSTTWVLISAIVHREYPICKKEKRKTIRVKVSNFFTKIKKKIHKFYKNKKKYSTLNQICERDGRLN